MKRYRFFLLASFLLISARGFAQSTLPMARNIQKAYENGTRSMDGTPGKNYWQNSANYKINVTFSPETRLLSGSEEITYNNASPDTLHQIWFKLYPNLYKRGSQRDQNIKPEDLSDGVQIGSLSIDGVTQDAGKAHVRGTNMIVDIKPLTPGQKMRFNVSFSYVLNKTSHIRTGEVEKGSYFIAYFFPRIAVYDDVHGWNKIPYTGTQEFYNDFCNFDTRITVPKNYVVWATGSLQNGDSVLASKYVQRIKKAETNDGITTIIDTTDLAQGKITAQNPTNTWHFRASDVTDFVFATSDHYIWKSSSLVVDPKTDRRTRVDAAFDPKHKDYFDVIHYARKTVEAMSYTFPKWPYPYPHETIYDGLDQMEYPMMVNDNPLENSADAIELTDHEIFHTMFPFYMGTNETRYAWMDEGWATIGEWIISPIIDSTIVDKYGTRPYDFGAGNEEDLPIITPSTQENGFDYYLNSYPKPALGYLYVKDMLGDKLFTKALHHYIEEWHGKHPIPYDFFYSMNKGSGKNLDWFWNNWFFEKGYPDLAIARVRKSGRKYTVTVESKGNKIVPVDLAITYEDQSTQKIHRDISCWQKGNKTVSISFKSNKKVQEVMLGSTYDADSDQSNNTYFMNK